MNTFLFGRRSAIRTVPVLALVAGILLATGVTAVPAEAQTFELRRGVAVGENGAAGRTRSSVSNGEGTGAARRGVFAVDGQGNGAAASGGCVTGQSGSGCRGRAANWNSDGSVSGQSATEAEVNNGVFSGRRSVARDADGNLTAAQSVDASGERGAYTGESSLDDGTYNRDGTYSGDEGQSATVEGNWAVGAGGSRAVTCVDATGAVVACR